MEILGPTENSCLRTKTFIEAAAESERYYKDAGIDGTLSEGGPAIDDSRASSETAISDAYRDEGERTPQQAEADSIFTNEDRTWASSVAPSADHDSDASSEGGAVEDAQVELHFAQWVRDGSLRKSLERSDDAWSFKSNPCELSVDTQTECIRSSTYI